jgi:hypothetical protein
VEGKMKKVVLSVSLIILFSSCGEKGTIDLAGRTSLPTKLIVLTPFTEAEVDDSLRFIAEVPEFVPSVSIVKNSEGETVLLGYTIPDHLAKDGLEEFAYSSKRVIGPRSTAAALVVMNPIFLGVEDRTKIEVLKRVVRSSEFEQLVKKIEDAIKKDGSISLSKHEDIYILAAQVVKSVVDTSEIGEVKGAVTIDQNAPWFETYYNNGVRSGIKFFNPKMVYYWAGVKEQQNGNEIDDHWLQPKLRIIDLSIENLLKFDLSADPKETVWSNASLCGGTYKLISMFKGFRGYLDLNMFTGPLNAERKALLANTWQGIKYVLALVTSVNILPDGHLVVEGLDYILNPNAQGAYEDLMEAIKSYDIWDIISAVINLISMFKDPIKNYLFSSFGQNVSDSFLSAALGVIGDIAGIAVKVYNLTTQTIPFFYDFIDAPEEVRYWASNCAITDSGPALISFIKPNYVVSGKTISVWGSSFGEVKGKINIYLPNSNEKVAIIDPSLITMWLDTFITFYTPNLAAGSYEFTIAKPVPGGGEVESIKFPFNVVLPGMGPGEGGGAGGGGGCVYTGTNPQGLSPLLIIPLLFIVFYRLKRK